MLTSLPSMNNQFPILTICKAQMIPHHFFSFNLYSALKNTVIFIFVLRESGQEPALAKAGMETSFATEA